MSSSATETTPLLWGQDNVNQQEPQPNHESEGEVEIETPVIQLNVKYQSLDYDNCENIIYQREEKKKSYKDVVHIQLARWFVMLMIGVLTGCIAAVIDVSITNIAKFKFELVKHVFDTCYAKACLSFPLLLWIGFNCVAVFVASVFVAYVAPVAAGSGIPQIKCFLNGIKVPEVVRIKTLWCKVLGVILSVCGGLTIGKEGPMIHSGAVVAAGVSQGRSTTFNLDFKIFEYFRTDTEKRDFVSGGAAAGVSAAFGAPVGGVLFALEEGASFWNQSLTWRIFFASMMATFTLNVIQSYAHGQGMHLSYAGLINFGKFEESQLHYDGFEILIYIAMGAIGGLLGALFNYINFKLSIFRKSYVYRRWTCVMESVIVALMTTVVAFMLSTFVADCQALGKDPNEHTLQVHCNDGEYNSMATMWMETPEEAVKSLFHDPPEAYRPLTLVIFATLYFLLATWTYGLCVPSGLFIPCLLTGAAWGRLVSLLLNWLWPNSDWVEPGKFALIGAAAQLGGVVRMTISLTVILIEATGNISFGLPIMIVLMVAKWVGDMFNEGLYDIHIELAGVPILSWEPPPLTSNIFAREVMMHPVVTLHCTEKVGKIMDILKKERANGFPVVDDSSPSDVHDDTPTDPHLQSFGVLRGNILRSQLLILLKKKAWLNPTGYRRLVSDLTLKDFRDTYPRFPSLEHIHISVFERECLMDLRPFMNPAPYVVFENTSLPRVFKLFRGLGLRHLMVVNSRNEIVGVVARKDLARYRFHSHQGQVRIEELQVSTDH